MAKSLKEALLEKFADLQQLGIAPTTAPPMDDDGPAVVVEMGPDSYGTGGGRRQRLSRGGGYDDDTGRGGDVPIRPRGARRGGAGGRGGERGERGRGGPPQMGTTERLQRNAELKRREEGMREQLQGLLNTVGGLDVTPEVYDKWLADLTVETGALPPIDRVVEAIQLANSIEAAKVGN